MKDFVSVTGLPPARSNDLPSIGRMHRADPIDRVRMLLPDATCGDGEITPTLQRTARVTEPDLLFWSVHIPAGVLSTGLLLAVAFGFFALAVLTATGGTTP